MVRVSDTELQRDLLLAHPKTLDDTITHEQEFEAAMQSSKMHTRLRTLKEEEPLDEKLERIISKFLPKQGWTISKTGNTLLESW